MNKEISRRDEFVRSVNTQVALGRFRCQTWSEYETAEITKKLQIHEFFDVVITGYPKNTAGKFPVIGEVPCVKSFMQIRRASLRIGILFLDEKNVVEINKIELSSLMFNHNINYDDIVKQTREESMKVFQILSLMDR